MTSWTLSKCHSALEACPRAEHKCGRFTTDQESVSVHVPGEALNPTQDADVIFIP